MFFQGFINENLESIVENIFLIGKEENIPLDAILDTGFNGMFCKPRRLAPYCELIRLGLETFELADRTLVLVKEKGSTGARGQRRRGDRVLRSKGAREQASLGARERR